MRLHALATIWRALTEPLARIGRPRPLHSLRLRPGDVRALEIRMIEELTFHAELTWRKPSGERGMVHMICEYPELRVLLAWLSRVADIPADFDERLFEPAGDRPIVDMVLNEN